MHNNQTPRTPLIKLPRLLHHRRHPGGHAGRVLGHGAAGGRVVDGLDRGLVGAWEGLEDQVDEDFACAEGWGGGGFAGGEYVDLGAGGCCVVVGVAGVGVIIVIAVVVVIVGGGVVSVVVGGGSGDFGLRGCLRGGGGACAHRDGEGEEEDQGDYEGDGEEEGGELCYAAGFHGGRWLRCAVR